ncbi:MAG: PspC domain-containing protein, partial [Actinomycetota bacterium]|nr:PspC domain-containing protein [Actinomycetota bacterium]
MTQTPGTAPDTAPDISPEGGPRVDRRQMRDLTTLRRSKDNRMVAGVCEGLSRHFDIDPIVIRVVFAALTIFGGAGIVLYALAWLTIPEEGAYDSPASGWLRRDPERILVAGLSIAAVAAVATMIGAIGVSAPNPFPAVVVGLAALAVFAIFTRRRPDTGTRSARTPAAPAAETRSSSPAVEATSGLPPGPRTRPPPSPRPRRPRSRLLSVTIATVAITLGAIWVLDETVVEEMEPSVYPGTALGIIAVALLLGSWFGRSRFLIVLGLVASVATVATTVIGPGPHGESIYRPTATAEVRSSYD